MKVYVVTENGEFRNHILGVYTRPGAAHSRAENLAQAATNDQEYFVGAAEEDSDIEDVDVLVSYRKVSGQVRRVVRGV